MNVLNLFGPPKGTTKTDLSHTQWIVGCRDENDVFHSRPTSGHTVGEVFAELSEFIDEAAENDQLAATFFVCRGADAGAEGEKG